MENCLRFHGCIEWSQTICNSSDIWAYVFGESLQYVYREGTFWHARRETAAGIRCALSSRSWRTQRSTIESDRRLIMGSASRALENWPSASREIAPAWIARERAKERERTTEGSSRIDPPGKLMKTSNDVVEMLRQVACGWGLKRIAPQLGDGHYGEGLRGGGRRSPERRKWLHGLEGRLRKRFIRHGGDADLVRQDLLVGKGVAVSPRTWQPCRAALSLGAEGRSAVDDAVSRRAAADGRRRASSRDRGGVDQGIRIWRRLGIRGGCMSVRFEPRRVDSV